VNGTAGGDDIIIRRLQQAFRVNGSFDVFLAADGSVLTGALPEGPYLQVNYPEGTFNVFVQADGIRRITIDGGAGDDHLIIDRSVNLKTTLFGSRGNDTLQGGVQGDALFGGDGNDALFGGPGTAADSLDAGNGADKIISSARDTVAPNSSDDLLLQGTFSSSTEPFRLLGITPPRVALRVIYSLPITTTGQPVD
jgi:Ca2+-binding RTX toxin-like protein